MQQEPTIPHPPEQFTRDLPPMPDNENLSSPEPKQKKGEGWRSIASTLVIVILAPVLALLLINFVFQSYEVDGQSMDKTLQNADRLIVWKVPRTIARVTHKDYIPHRGDVIIFVKHGLYESGSSTDKQLIKRVIGLPRDRVVVSDGKVTVYNEQNPNGFDPDNGAAREEFIKYTGGNTDITVEDGQIFVLGDNRGNSLDSRVFGSIEAKDIIGKLEFRIFPFNTFKQF